MDAAALYELQDLSDRRKEVDHLLTFAIVDQDRNELRDERRSLTRKLNKLLDRLDGNYGDNFVDCRDMGHTWQKVGAALDDRDLLERTLHCPRCDTFRIDKVTSGGEIAYRRYSHPENYLIVGAGQTTPKTFWRGLAYLAAVR